MFIMNSPQNKFIYNEGGCSVAWFTELLTSSKDKQLYITILRHGRLHRDERERWPEVCKNAQDHPNYYGACIWKEATGRIATHYFVPEHGWLPISNPLYIFDYPEFNLV